MLSTIVTAVNIIVAIIKVKITSSAADSLVLNEKKPMVFTKGVDIYCIVFCIAYVVFYKYNNKKRYGNQQKKQPSSFHCLPLIKIYAKLYHKFILNILFFYNKKPENFRV